MNIDEWQPLRFDDFRGLLLVAFMVLGVWALVRSRTPERFQTVLPIVALAVATFAVVRAGAFMLIVVAPAIAISLSTIRVPRIRAWAVPRVGALVTGILVAGITLAVQQMPELSGAGDPGPRFSEELVTAIPTGCRLLNEYDLGGFVIDRRWPEVLVSQDGRNDLYGTDELRRQADWLDTEDPTPPEAAGVNCVLADPDRALVGTLRERSDWSVAGESAELVLLVRQG